MKIKPTYLELEKELKEFKSSYKLLLSSKEDITELKSAEENLINAINIIERSPSVVFLWKNLENWPVEYVSKNVYQLFGYTSEEFLTGKINYKELIHLGDVTRITEELAKINNSNIFTHEPYRIVTKTGEIKWVKDDIQIRRNKNNEITHYEGVLLDITESVKNEQELVSLNLAIENSLNEVFIFSAQNLKITFANETAIKNIGYTFEELKKMTPIDLSPEFTKEKALKKLEPLKSGEIDKLHFETIRQRKDKTLYPVEIYVSKFSIQEDEHFLALIIDITDRKVAEIKINENQQKFKAFTNQSSEGISVADLKGNYTFVNPAFCTMVGYSEKELLKMTVFDVTADKNDKKTFEKTTTVKEGTPLIVELLRKDNSTFVAEVIGKNLSVNGEKFVLGTIRDITEIKVAEQQLKVSERLLKEAQIIAKIGHWELNLLDNKLTWSDEVFRIFNLKPQEFKPAYATFLDKIHQKDKETFNNTYIDSLENNKPFEITIRLLLNSNEIKYVFINGYTEFNEEGKPARSLGTIQDITESKQAELKLTLANQKTKESEKRFRSLFNNSPVSLWEEDISGVLQLLNKKLKEEDNLKKYLDENSDFVYECASKIKVLNVNNSTLGLLGVKTKEELINNLSSSFNSKSFDTLKEELLMLANKETKFKRETEFIRSDGKVITVFLEFVLLGKSRIIVSMNDITELIEAKKKAEESDRLKTEFISNMSHEIRTPMNGIMGFSELLGDPDLIDEKRKYFVQIIKNSGKQLLQIIDDIIEISKLGTKQVKVYEESVNLNDLLLELFSIFDSKAKENKTPLYLEKGLSDKQSIILTDRSKLNKIVSNLLENALKFTNVGSIEFGYKLKNNEESSIVEIYVKDTGIGIKPEDQKLIFERFIRANKEDSKKVKGLGLGLSIAKENSLLLGGEISVESIVGKGTTFFITIPYKPVFNEIEITNEMLQERQTILIVEDEEVNYLYLDTLLKDVLKLNCIILHAKNGKEAIDICKSNTAIDLILMDLKMPVMNGYEATKEIKKLYPSIPIIAQTAYSTNEEQEKAIIAGCNAFISKPITKESLFNIINKFVPQL
ncbi:PAS domain S-box protein [uncultured Lutibacter sp.]|uniref:PAS domain S-box protein n=1 Tax=uncultured Lutibacter sp. TaxID=437739 RepID=UPI002613EA7E|nr:PAS domain S-box protein [uncultured Lutibacter sp.]